MNMLGSCRLENVFLEQVKNQSSQIELPPCNREKGEYEWDGKWEQHYENGQLISKGLIQWVKQKHLLKLLSQALEEKTMALRLCMEYLSHTSKDNPVSFALPQINNALDASQAAGRILTAVNE